MILHCHIDTFYASIEERDRPELVGKPVIVGGAPQDWGVVSAANYLARRFGVHSALPTAAARRLCPKGVFLPPRIDYYTQVAAQVREIFERFTPLVEPLSLDEAYLDVHGSERLFGPPAEVGRKIKQAIAKELRLTASVGVASNKLVAKIAGDLGKPDGFMAVEAGQTRFFLEPLPVERLWGVGRETSQIFQQLAVHTIGQLRRWPIDTFRACFGPAGEPLWELAHGIDNRLVVPEREAKAIAHETTFERDIEEQKILRAWLADLVEQIGWRLRHAGLRGRTVNLKLRYVDFSTVTRSQTLAQATDITEELLPVADEMLCRHLPPNRLPVRLLGLGVSELEPSGSQPEAPLDEEAERQKQASLTAAANQMRRRVGRRALRRGISPGSSPPPRPPDAKKENPC
ncbi:MAG: DNA polymerase IV [Thermoguttaceae bacterium]|jgi:DNA polymerase-4